MLKCIFLSIESSVSPFHQRNSTAISSADSCRAAHRAAPFRPRAAERNDTNRYFAIDQRLVGDFGRLAGSSHNHGRRNRPCWSRRNTIGAAPQPECCPESRPEVGGIAPVAGCTVSETNIAAPAPCSRCISWSSGQYCQRSSDAEDLRLGESDAILGVRQQSGSDAAVSCLSHDNTPWPTSPGWFGRPQLRFPTSRAMPF